MDCIDYQAVLLDSLDIQRCKENLSSHNIPTKIKDKSKYIENKMHENHKYTDIETDLLIPRVAKIKGAY